MKQKTQQLIEENEKALKEFEEKMKSDLDQVEQTKNQDQDEKIK